MGSVSRVHTFSSGAVLTAAQLNNEFDNLLTSSAINGGLDATNLGVTAGQATASKALVIDSSRNLDDGTTSNQINNLVLSGTLTVAGATTQTGALSIDDTTDSTSTTTGSIHTDGGVGIAKDLIVGNDVKVGGGYGATGATISTAGVGQFNGALTTDGALTGASLVCTAAGTFGGGYGATGATISTAGVIQANGAITSDGAVTGATLAGTISTAAQNSITSASSLATVGTITSGTWSGVIDGSATMTLGSDATGDIYYRDASGFLERLASGADGTVLTGTGAGAIPAWESPAVGDITSVVAGAGMTGGGTTGDVTLNVIGGDGITANADDVAITAAQTTVTSVYNASLKMGRDSQNLIDFATTDNKIILRVNNVDEVELVADTLQPTTSDGVALGTASLMWSDLFLASGSVINFAAGDVTLTHSSETLTVAGGTLAAAGITGTTIDATTDFTIGDTVITDGVITDTSGLSVASATTVASTLTVGANTDGHDVKFFGNATGSYMEWDESADQLRILGPSTDAAGSSGKLLLATAQVAVASGDILGQIDFQAPLETGTDATAIAAAIKAVAQDTFSATVNSTDLIFYTGHSEAATEKFRMTSQGELGVGGANYGTDGQVLTSAGAGAAAAWESVSAGVSLSGSTNNTVATVTGANALEGEANLTFDGSTLTVTGDQHIANGSGLVVGNTAQVATNTLTGEAQIQGTANNDSLFSISRYSADGTPPRLHFAKSRNATIGNVTGAVQSGDDLGSIGFCGSDGTDFNNLSASIGAVVSGSVSGDTVPVDLIFNTGTAATERMRIGSNGHVAIGHTDTTIGVHADLSVSGNHIAKFVNSSATNPYGLRVDMSGASPDNNSVTVFAFNDSTAHRMSIYSDGDVWTSDAGTLTSDERLKTNIVDASDKLADLMRLQVRNYEWTPEYHPNKVGEKKIGFIAQELETVFPALISEHDIAIDNAIVEQSYDADDDIPEGKEIGDVKIAAKAHEPTMRKSYKNAFVPILVKALQEVTTRLEAAEAKITALESA